MNEKKEARAYPARVVEVLEPTRLVINRGRLDGVREGQNFLVYAVREDELIDPEGGDSLGHLEIVRGRGEAIHVQERLATLESSEMESQQPERTVVRRLPSVRTFSFGHAEYEMITPRRQVRVPFREPERGDFVKPV